MWLFVAARNYYIKMPPKKMSKTEPKIWKKNCLSIDKLPSQQIHISVWLIIQLWHGSLLHYLPDVVYMVMDAGRCFIDRKTPTLVINGFLTILRSQGFRYPQLWALLMSSQSPHFGRWCVHLHACFWFSLKLWRFEAPLSLSSWPSF